MLEQAKREEARICAEVTDLSKLKQTLAEQRDLLAALSVRLEQLARQRAELVEPLRAIYPNVKRELCFLYDRLRKAQPSKAAALAQAVGFYGLGLGGYSWPFEGPQKCEPGKAELFDAAEILERRFAALNALDPTVKVKP